MTAFPNGFFRLQGASGATMLAFNCQECATYFLDVDRVTHCGRTDALSKPTADLPLVKMGAEARAAVDLGAGPVRLRDRIFGLV